jgi:hypothetical protein
MTLIVAATTHSIAAQESPRKPQRNELTNKETTELFDGQCSGLRRIMGCAIF